MVEENVEISNCLYSPVPNCMGGVDCKINPDFSLLRPPPPFYDFLYLTFEDNGKTAQILTFLCNLGLISYFFPTSPSN